MIDWHSHVLPGMDDGSKDLQESTALLDMLRQQGVDTVIATPHFYPNNESAARFLQRRAEACQRLAPCLSAEMPRVLCGAEVYYYPGISRLTQLPQLCIANKLLLLEMPLSKWTEFTVRELIELAQCSRFILVLAHIERYLPLQSKATWNRLYEAGILMQVNASFFLRFRTRRKAITMLRQGRIHLIGSDCHNTTSRPPLIGEARNIICKKLGEAFFSQFIEQGYALLLNQ